MAIIFFLQQEKEKNKGITTAVKEIKVPSDVLKIMNIVKKKKKMKEKKRIQN